MTAHLGHPVSYELRLGEHSLPLNNLLGERVKLSYEGEIHCVACGRLTGKSYRQGYCFPCTRRLAACDICIVKPELCPLQRRYMPRAGVGGRALYASPCRVPSQHILSQGGDYPQEPDPDSLDRSGRCARSSSLRSAFTPPIGPDRVLSRGPNLRQDKLGRMLQGPPRTSIWSRFETPSSMPAVRESKPFHDLSARDRQDSSRTPAQSASNILFWPIRPV